MRPARKYEQYRDLMSGPVGRSSSCPRATPQNFLRASSEKTPHPCQVSLLIRCLAEANAAASPGLLWWCLTPSLLSPRSSLLLNEPWKYDEYMNEHELDP